MCGEKDQVSGTRCLCRPYRSPLLTASQVLSVIAFAMSWVWWGTMVFGLPAMVVLQVVWCCKMTKAGIISAAVLAACAAIVSTFAGAWALYDWKYQEYCWVFFYDDIYWNDDYFEDTYDPRFDECNEVAWGVIALIDAALWGLVSMLISYVICFDNFDMVRKLNSPEEAAPEPERALEMGTTQYASGVATVPAEQPSDPAAGKTDENV